MSGTADQYIWAGMWVCHDYDSVTPSPVALPHKCSLCHVRYWGSDVLFPTGFVQPLSGAATERETGPAVLLKLVPEGLAEALSVTGGKAAPGWGREWEASGKGLSSSHLLLLPWDAQGTLSCTPGSEGGGAQGRGSCLGPL